MINYILHSLIAQLVEHSAVNRVVAGSSPARGAILPSTPAPTFIRVMTHPSQQWMLGCGICYLRYRWRGTQEAEGGALLKR